MTRVTPEQLWQAAEAASVKRGTVRKPMPWDNMPKEQQKWWKGMAAELNRILVDAPDVMGEGR